MTLFAERDLRPLSALQHFLFCERQCALIHLEQEWAENRYTAEGRVLHEKADSGVVETRGDLRIVRSLPLRSLRLGLVGRADVVEFRRLAAGNPESEGAQLPGLEGSWRPYPVETKRGRPKKNHCDEVQLCAQALCLEEMLGVTLPEGALFYGKKRRRKEVRFDPTLRRLTEETALRVHQQLDRGLTPPAVRDKRCDRCSLMERCLPSSPSLSARAYLEGCFEPTSAGGSE